MKNTYWPDALQELLRTTYGYDPLSGEVRRLLAPTRGPSVKGQIGTLSPAGTLKLNVAFGGKQWVIPVHKLALFLHTGKQFPLVSFADGNKLNFALENLVAAGKAIVEGDLSEEQVKTVNEIAQRALIAKREATQRFTLAEKSQQREAAVKADRSDPDFVPERVFSRPTHQNNNGVLEPFVDYQANWDMILREKMAHEQRVREEILELTPFSKYLRAKRDRRAAIRSEREKTELAQGLYTGISYAEMLAWCTSYRKAHTIEEDNTQYCLRHKKVMPNSEDYLNMTKVERDYLLGCRLQELVRRGLSDVRSTEGEILHNYMHEGVPVFNTLLRFTEREVELDRELLVEFGFETEQEAIADAVSKMEEANAIRG